MRDDRPSVIRCAVGLPACVADVTSGSCQPVHGFEPGTPAPLGAAFKLYVLDALGVPRAIGCGFRVPDQGLEEAQRGRNGSVALGHGLALTSGAVVHPCARAALVPDGLHGLLLGEPGAGGGYLAELVGVLCLADLGGQFRFALP